MKDGKVDTVTTDPILDVTMQEITKLLDKRKIAGHIVLISQSHARYCFHLARWTQVRIDGDEIRMTCKREDFPSQSAWKSAMEDMAYFVYQMRDLSKGCYDTFQMLVARLQEHLEIDHKQAGHVPGQGQVPDK